MPAFITRPGDDRSLSADVSRAHNPACSHAAWMCRACAVEMFMQRETEASLRLVGMLSEGILDRDRWRAGLDELRRIGNADHVTLVTHDRQRGHMLIESLTETLSAAAINEYHRDFHWQDPGRMILDKTGTLTQDKIILEHHLDSAGQRDDAVLELAIKGLGMAWLPHSLASAAVRSGLLKVLGGRGDQIHFEVRLYRHRAPQSALVEAALLAGLILANDATVQRSAAQAQPPAPEQPRAAQPAPAAPVPLPLRPSKLQS